MNIKFFIDQKALSIVISIFIVILGYIGYKALPIEQYPDIAPPTVSVMANYPGANAETIEKSVLTPIEIAINGVEDMLYMSSEVNNSGECYISVFFKQGTDADMAVVNVKNRIAMATPNLPAEVNQIGVNVEKQQKSVLRNFVLRSPNGTYDPNFLANYVKIEIEPALLRVSGVGYNTSPTLDSILLINKIYSSPCVG